jgi:hypothetical protein
MGEPFLTEGFFALKYLKLVVLFGRVGSNETGFK